jgi:hypothetical protein
MDLTVANGDQDAAASLGSIGRRIWGGAKEALRQLTYWQMKRRAGTVGQKGLGPLIADLSRQAPGVRVHLIGHSFGCRLVSFSLLGLSDTVPSPVHSLTMLEGAFSHWAFAKTLPMDPNRSGALSGGQTKVEGPIVSCFSSFDTAVGILYPLASMASGEDAAALEGAQLRWGAMGHDGAQGVGAANLVIQEGLTAYEVPKAGFVNVDAASVVKTGSLPSGAHSDIFHPELAGVLLAAAGLV